MSNKIFWLIRRVKDKGIRKVHDVQVFGLYLKRNFFSKSHASGGDKAVWLDIHQNCYTRYIYLLVKWFRIAGYKVYMKSNLKFITSLGDLNSRLIIEENEVGFCNEPPAEAIRFSESDHAASAIKISNRYFNYSPAKADGCYHIPIGMHPRMYKENYWSLPVQYSSRFQSIFFAGNFDMNNYTQLTAKNKFPMLNRVQMLERLRNLKETRFPSSLHQLKAHYSNGTIDVVVTSEFEVPAPQLRNVLSHYYFFLACPGVHMPLSHNVVEAMSVGCIPIMHEEYAKWYAPILKDGETAILFNNDNFEEKVAYALQMEVQEVKELSEQALHYYQKNLTPESIVAEMTSGKYKKCFLNAEKTSVRLYQRTS